MNYFTKSLLAILVIGGLWISGCSKAPVTEPLAVVNTTVSYATPADAAIAVVRVIFKDHDSTQIEFGGFIVLLNGRYYYTTPVTNKSTDSVHYKYQHMDGATIVGLYHTHPNPEHDHLSTLFSDTDINTSTKMKVNSYLGVNGDESGHKMVLIFAPGKTKTHKEGSYTFAIGSLLGRIS